MVTIPAGLVIDLNSSDEGTTTVGFRRALAVLFKQSSPGVPVPGRLGADHFVVSGAPAAMEYNVSGGGLLLIRSSTNGAYLVGSPSALVVPTAASDGVNPRIDVIYAMQPDPALDGSGVDVEAIVDVAVGTPGASPAVPSIPSGALELARKVVAAGATNTQDGAAFTDVAATTGLYLGDVLDVSVIPSLPATKIGSGTLGISRGGTGGATASAARSSLGLGDVAVENVLPLAKGGTGAATKAAARAALGITDGDGTPSGGDDGDIYFERIT